MRVLTDNLIFNSQTILTASSSNSYFPVNNVKNEFRNKHWRSTRMTGLYDINSSNKYMDMVVNGVSYSIALDEGTYTYSSLKTEFNSKMFDFYGNTDFHIDQDPGTGIWGTWCSDYLITQYDIMNGSGSNANNSFFKFMGFGTSDLTGSGPSIGYAATSATVGYEYIDIDLGEEKSFNSFVFLFQKTGRKMSNNTKIEVTTYYDAFVSPHYVLTLQNSDSMKYYGLLCEFLSYNITSRYIRVKVMDYQNSNGFFELGVAWIGEGLALPNADKGFLYNVVDTSKVTENAFGNEYVDEYPTFATLNLKFGVMEYSQVKILERAYRDCGLRKPILVVMDELSTTFDDYNFCIYGKFNKPFNTKHINYLYLDSDLVIEEKN